MIELLLVRHGQAVEEAPGLGDEGRWLTASGRTTTREVASWLAAHESRRAVEIWTSPLVRSVQTAEILATALGLVDGVSAKSELLPAGEAAALVDLIARRGAEGPLAIVGHEPLLSDTARLLLPAVVWPGFKKSGVLSVAWDGAASAELRFLLRPKKMRLLRELAPQSKRSAVLP